MFMQISCWLCVYVGQIEYNVHTFSLYSFATCSFRQ